MPAKSKQTLSTISACHRSTAKNRAQANWSRRVLANSPVCRQLSKPAQQKRLLSRASVENLWDIHRIECVEQRAKSVRKNSVQVSYSSNTSLVQRVNATVNH
jgi:hypothetical protein